MRSLVLSLLALSCCLVAAPAATAGTMTTGIEANNQMLADPATQTAALDEMQRLGVKVVRVALLWNGVAVGPSCALPATGLDDLRLPSDPCYDWSKYDAVVSGARARGIDVLFSVSSVPGWVNGGAGEYTVGKSEAGFQLLVRRYSAFVAAAASRYSASSSVGFVRYWTIWNEMNSRTFWMPWNGSTPRRYAYLYVQAAKALRAASPAAKIAPGPTGPNSTGMKPVAFIKATQPWLRKYGARKYIDAWAHNPYPVQKKAPRTKAYKAPLVGIGNLGDLYKALDANPVTRGKKVWATEFAFETKPEDRSRGTSYRNQATWLAECFDILWSSRRVSLAFWYVMTDPPTGTVDWQSGLLRVDGSKKPSYAMYQRPISRSTERARRGQLVTIWGKSNIAPGSASLVWSKNGRGGWKRLGGQRGGGPGVKVAKIRAKRTMFVAVRDARGVGPARKLTVR